MKLSERMLSDEWYQGMGRKTLADEVAQLEDELKSRTETLDAIEDGKTAEYWRTCFYHQQDLQKQLEAENAALLEKGKLLAHGCGLDGCLYAKYVDTLEEIADSE